MKRILSVILVLFMLTSVLFACGTEDGGLSSIASDVSLDLSGHINSTNESENTSDSEDGDVSIYDNSYSDDVSEPTENSNDVSENSTPTEDKPAETLSIPQRLFVTDGKEVYTRLYSMYVSKAEEETLKNEANSLRSLMVGAEYGESPIGGAEYSGKIYKTGDYVVKTDDELKRALAKAKSGEVIFIPSGVTIDISDLYTTESFNVSLSSGVILASDRGINEGGVLKFSHPSGAMIICGNNTTVTGLNICGVITAYGENSASVLDIGVRVMGKNVTVSNCEFASFSGDAISASANSSADVDNCYIHHCQNGVKITNDSVSVKNSAFFANNTDYKYANGEASLPETNAVLKTASVDALTVKRVQPDITASVFPADGYEVYSLLGEVASGKTSLLREALAVHSGTTNYYEYKNELSIEQNGKAYGITDEALPLGGGKGYERIYTSGDYTVNDASSLISALSKAKSGQTVFIDGNAKIDLTGYDITVPAGVTLASDRGRVLADGSVSSGAMLYTTVREKETVFLSENSAFCGITLVGADTERHMTHLSRGLNDEGTRYTDYYYSLPLTRGISINGDGAEVANCEISGFSEAGVYVRASVDVTVHHCFIHHNQRNGYGYGVVLYGAAYVELYADLFNFDRHAIAADGAANSGYIAHDNVHAGTAIYHIFDAHGGGDRGDGTQIACERIEMYNNAFLSDKIPYKKRGTPEEYSKFTRNVVIYPESYYQYRLLYGTNFICEDNIWGIAEPDIPDYSFSGGKTYTLTAGGDVRYYSDMEYIDSDGYSLRYAYFLVFTPKGDGYYISEYGNNLDDGSIYGWNEKVYIPKDGFVIAFTNRAAAAKQLYDAIAARHGVIYNTSLTLDGDYIATYENGKITVAESK